jgi:hypothetical protein
MPRTRHLQAIRAALAALVNDTALTDRQRLGDLQTIDAEINGYILDWKARLPEPPSRRGDPPRI